MTHVTEVLEVGLASTPGSGLGEVIRVRFLALGDFPFAGSCLMFATWLPATVRAMYIQLGI